MQTTASSSSPARPVKIRNSYENMAWRWMRYSAFLLIPLAWGHILIQDIIIGVHAIDLDYVALRWSMIGWRIYDVLLLGFAFAHGVNGLRQVLLDYIHSATARRATSWVLFLGWLAITLIGAIAIIGGVKQP